MAEETTEHGDHEDRLAQGEVISGRFVVDSSIGAGGMGRIYLAHQRPFNRPVALKVMHRNSSKNRELVERFFQEASTVSHLAHPNTVTVYDFGRTESGLLYIAMELIDGVSLGDEIRSRRAIPADEAIPYAIQIAQSLGEAHHKGLVHRDLKPDNVMVCNPDGSDAFVKVLDFGIAKVLGKDASWTEVGNIVGTPYYMAPEQAKGLDVDGRTDLYSLGCCLYEMLTGNPPFRHESPVQVLMAHQNEPVPDLPPGFHPALDAFVQRTLAKDPDDRPSDAATFVAELLATVIEIRAGDSYSGYTPSPDMMSSRNSPLPLLGSMTPSRAKSPPPARNLGPSSMHSDSSSWPIEDGRISSENVALARTVERPKSAEEAARDISPGPENTGTNPWKWAAIAFFIVASGALVLSFSDALSGDASGAETAHVATAAPVVTLTVESEPPGAIVFVDDQAIGKSPTTYPVLASDSGESIEVRIEKLGYESYQGSIPTAGRDTAKVFAPLERKRLKVRFESKMNGTAVTIDGKEYGSVQAGQPREITIPFPTNELVVEFVADGFQPYLERFEPSVIDARLDISVSADDFVAKPPSKSE